MTKKAIALLSGGFDSMLAVRIMQEQGFEVEGLNVVTPFCDTSQTAMESADELGISCRCVHVGEDYLELLRHPRYGFGKACNPCLDCHLYMIQMARRRLEETKAQVVVSGEVLGQRPMSQQRHHLEMLDYHSGLAGRLVRPICAKLLPPTVAELEGVVDRERLYGLSGRGRAPLHQLGRDLGIRTERRAMAGCCLTEKTFAPRVRDLLRHENEATQMWEYEILRWGRHIRLDETSRCVLGRRESDCDALQERVKKYCATRSDVIYWEPETYTGPCVMLIGRIDDQTISTAKNLQVAYSKNALEGNISLRKFYLGEELVESFVPEPGFGRDRFRTM
ncbi:MAG: hypothetical protein Q4D38_02900 [Planctomycetia bacterium]|nr:hypothetical protein [Planctomycetia bacterium]